MATILPHPLLRRVLLADAALSAGFGAMIAGLAGPIAELTGLPPALLRWAGLLLLPWSAALLVLALRPRLAAAAVWAVIALNAAWAADSLILLASGLVAPTGLGIAFVLAQAALVAAVAAVQTIGLRRSGPAAA